MDASGAPLVVELVPNPLRAWDHQPPAIMVGSMAGYLLQSTFVATSRSKEISHLWLIAAFKYLQSVRSHLQSTLGAQIRSCAEFAVPGAQGIHAIHEIQTAVALRHVLLPASASGATHRIIASTATTMAGNFSLRMRSRRVHTTRGRD